MSNSLQNIIAFALVAGCVAYVAWQLLKTVRAGNGKAGACCSKGCGGDEPDAPAVAATPREQFIASDSLRRRR